MKTPAQKLHPSISTIEPLEARIAPASFTFTDVDGDMVTIKVSSSSLVTDQDVQNAATLQETAPGSGMFQLQSLNLTDSKFIGASVEVRTDFITAPVGDGFVNVGAINATGRDLGTVIVIGDLGQIDAGDGDATKPAILRLFVESMGVFGATTQGAGGDLVSTINGAVNGLTICGALDGAQIVILGGADGMLKKAEIGSIAGGGADLSGRLSTSGDAGTIVIKGGIEGSAGNSSGTISIGGKVKSVTVGGNVEGGSGPNSGSISVGGVKTGITVNGDLEGGSGAGSGKINSNGATNKVKVGGSVKGSGDGSGQIALNGPTKGVEIGRDILGGGGPGSGSVLVNGRLDFASVGGNLVGGAGNNSGILLAAFDLGKVSLRGSLIGGLGDFSGALVSSGRIGSAEVWGDIVGGSVSGTDSLDRSGFIDANQIATLLVKGSVFAGENTGTGTLVRSGSIAVNRDFGTVVIMGSTVGNDSNPVVLSAAFSSNKEIVFKSITIGGSVIETDILAGYDTLGRPVNADAQIGPVTVGRDWLASNLVAGIFAGVDGVFGTTDDKAINPVDNPGSFNNPALFSTIGMVKIGCQAQGEPGLVLGQYGIVATKIAKIVTAGRTYSFTAAPADDVFRLGSTGGAVGDFFAREVAA